jgi:hypothetical protein
MNLTLSIDKSLLEKARKTAQSMGLSLNEMVRRYLAKVAGETDAVETYLELHDLLKTAGGRSGGRTWTREDLHRG